MVPRPSTTGKPAILTCRSPGPTELTTQRSRFRIVRGFLPRPVNQVSYLTPKKERLRSGRFESSWACDHLHGIHLQVWRSVSIARRGFKIRVAFGQGVWQLGIQESGSPDSFHGSRDRNRLLGDCQPSDMSGILPNRYQPGPGVARRRTGDHRARQPCGYRLSGRRPHN